MVTVLTTMLSQAGLWAEAHLVTGMIMDSIHGQAPSPTSVFEHPATGMKKAMVYGGVFMGSLYPWDALGSRVHPMGHRESFADRRHAGWGDRLPADQDRHRIV